MQQQRTPFPRHLDTPHQIVFWRVDEVSVLFVFIILGIIQNRLFTGMLIGLAAMYVYRRYRERHPNGYLRHAAYWYGLITLKGRSVLNPFQRKVLP